MTKLVNKALVVANYGKYALIELNGKHYNCTTRSKISGLIVGDEVEFKNDNNLVITKILTRKNLLTANHKNIASNLDEIFLVLAVKPYPQLLSIDNYLIKAKSSNIKVNILVNKDDLINKKITTLVKIYTDIGYSVSFISVKTKKNIKQLIKKMANKTCIFIGQSGVGKSSITNIITGRQQKISNLGVNGLGKHTTTNSSFFYLKNNGKIIDTPGVREFNPQELTKDEIINGFIEIKSLAKQCKFNNCLHIDEPKCEVKQQLELGNISKYRYKNYINLITEVNLSML